MQILNLTEQYEETLVTCDEAFSFIEKHKLYKKYYPYILANQGLTLIELDKYSEALIPGQLAYDYLIA